MIFETPELTPKCLQVIESINKLREELRFSTSNSLNRWTGFLARMTLARAIQESNTMEGINATFDDAVAAVDLEDPYGPRDENWAALMGHREAMDYIIQLSKEPKSYGYNDGTLLSLHYMMMRYDMSKNPGRWRPGGVFVTNTATGQVVYEGPDAALVRDLMNELLAALNASVQVPVMVRAAMAHLNLTMIHPFKDGNGRMARALQTMVLSKDAILSPVFSSIEEYVGTNAKEYYSVLADVGQGSWHPERDAMPWIRFCLTAHYRQAVTLLRRIREMAELLNQLEVEAKKVKLHPRVVNALSDAAFGLRVRNSTYRKQAEISNQVAKKDLAALMKLGWLVPQGERRGRCYVGGEFLKALRRKTRLPKNRLDPFDEAPTEQPYLPGLGPVLSPL